jgi:uncharacterized integral membrane protein
MSKPGKWLWFVLAALALIGFLVLIFVQVYVDSELNYGAAFPFRAYPGLMVAIASGFFGATFSMLVQCQKRASEGTLDDLGNASAWRTLIVRSSVGFGAAAIIYFFFRSGLLEGSLWPDLSQLKYEQLGAGASAGIVPNKDWCLLIIWSFLAGFSETLVPNILSKTEQRAVPT